AGGDAAERRDRAGPEQDRLAEGRLAVARVADEREVAGGSDRHVLHGFSLSRRGGSPRALRLRSKIMRSPSSVRKGSTRSIVRLSLAVRPASPPVAITRAPAPSSPRIRSTI